MGDVVLSGPKLMKQVTLHVRIKHLGVVQFRVWLMKWLIIFAAWVGGVGIEIED